MNESFSRPAELSVLILQGGGALGTYQAGAYESLAEHTGALEWVAGISIGSINAAIIAGNAPKMRVRRLRQFWKRVTSANVSNSLFVLNCMSAYRNEANAAAFNSAGAPGFFKPRFPPAAMMPHGTSAANSVYDTSPLRDTLEELVDFDRLNQGEVRMSVGAVNVARAT